MFKVAVHQEDKTIKTYIQEITEPQNIRHTLMNYRWYKKLYNKNWRLQWINQLDWRANKEAKGLKNTINKLYLTHTEDSIQQSEYFSSAQGTFSRIDHMWGYKTTLEFK